MEVCLLTEKAAVCCLYRDVNWHPPDYGQSLLHSTKIHQYGGTPLPITLSHPPPPQDNPENLVKEALTEGWSLVRGSVVWKV